MHKAMIAATAPRRARLFTRVRARTHWNSERIAAWQAVQLSKLIHYCWKYVPYYRSRWAPFISGPADIRGIADLERLPILTKDELRQELTSLTTTNRRIRSSVAKSGGSTGRPTVFRMTPYDEELTWAQMYVGWSWAGFRIGEPFLVVGGESIGVALTDRRTLRDWVMNRWVSSGSNLTLERARALASSPQFGRIRFIYGYPNAIRELGELLRELKAKPPLLRGIVCTAEVMRKEVRESIAGVFGVPVLDQYGLNDGGLLAIEGPERNGLHVFFYRAILEILDDNNRQISEFGKPGRAVATCLSNLATPFVRYETGDDVHWQTREPSPSGIHWPRIGPVDGRTGDVIYLPSGRRIAMPGLTLVMRWIDGLRQYQFLQTGPKDVTVVLDREPQFGMSEAEVKDYLRSKIANEIDWTIRWGAPELTRNHKFLIIRNDWLRNQMSSASERSVSEIRNENANEIA